MSGFSIHAVQLAEGILALSPLPGRFGRYAEDMEHVRDWRPSIVITLNTAEELAEAGCPDLGAAFVALGSRWVHLPVKDFGTPPEDMQKAWPETSKAALSALRGGGRVLVHCRGGCGRSGMVLLRLMVEAGEKPLEAVDRLRAVRPCAVETAGQMNWATRKR